MSHAKRELVRLVQSLEAQNGPKDEEDFANLPVRLMIDLTLKRIWSGFKKKLRLRPY